MSDGRKPTSEEIGSDGSAAGSASALGVLPAGIIDETPLEDFDEQSFLNSVSEDDQRPRFGAEAHEGATGLTVGEESEPLPPEEAGEMLAAIAESAVEPVMEEEALPVEGEGLDLGLDELDLAAIEEVAEDAAPIAAPEPAPQRAPAPEEAPKLPKFMFDVSFDLPEPEHFPEEKPAPEPEPEPEPEIPPPPTFSEEEMAAARQAGFADGQAEGYQQAMQSIESKIASGIDAVGLFLPDLLGQRDKMSLALANDAARLAHALVRRALPELNRRYGALEIEAAVVDAIKTAIDQPRIHIRVAPDIAERITAPVQSAADTAGYAGRITVVGDPSLGPADVRLEWGDGGVERMAEQVWASLTAIVARLVEGLEADTGLKSVAVDSAA